MQKIKFIVRGIKCQNCPLLIEQRLKDKSGVLRVKVDQTSNKGVVIYDNQKINASDICKTIEEIGGFKIEKLEEEARNSDENTDYKNPENSKDAKPPAESLLVQKIFVISIVLLLILAIFKFFT